MYDKKACDKYRKNHSEKIKENDRIYSQKYRKNNPEKIKKLNIQYYLSHKKEIRKQQTEYRQTENGRLKHNQGNNKYSKTNKGKLCLQKGHEKYRLKNIEKIQARDRLKSVFRYNKQVA